MGIAERKAKAKEELRAAILRAAQQLFAEKGIEQTTIRNIADAIEYSVGTVYLHFKDKNDILHSLHTQGFLQLGGNMRVLFSVDDPMERLKALGRVYIQFALDNPYMYDLMFSLQAPMDYLNAHECEIWHEGKNTFDVLKKTVWECMEAGYFKGHDLEPLSFMIWSTVHGMVNLYTKDRCNGVKFENPETIVERGFQEFLKMITHR